MEIDHKIISMVILPILLIQEGQLSVTGANMCTTTGCPLRELSLPRKSVIRLTGQFDMTITVLTGL